MDLKDPTKNQHFISQSEQRLNAINTDIDKKRQRIYEFNLEDRESYKIKLISDNGKKIEKNLSLNDLFSFEVLGSERYNFEKLFQEYENKIKYNTNSLLEKILINESEIKSEILNIFLYKFINFTRNPYSIKKIMNSFPLMYTYHPTEKKYKDQFDKILSGIKPQQELLCRQLNISAKEYSNWLSTIFLLLNRFDQTNPNIIEQIIKNLFEDPEYSVQVTIYTYTAYTCLLSDRGYSIPIPESNNMAFDFNLNSKTFIRYLFQKIDDLVPNGFNQEIVNNYKKKSKTINVAHFIDDLKRLEEYNQNVVYQCHMSVFNSTKNCYGINF